MHATVEGRGLRIHPLFILLLGCLSALADPQITSFSPAFGSATDPGNIIITGSGFAPGTVVVKFNGVAASPAGAISATTIQAHVTAGTPLGSNPIYVSVDSVSTLSPGDFTVIGPGPYVSAFTPSGAAGTVVSIDGAHFSSPITNKFNNLAVVTSTASSTHYTVTAPAGVTTGPITVMTSAGSYTTVSNFFVPPVVSSFSPATGMAGATVVITGTNFLGATLVAFNGVAATSYTVDNNNQITATVPANVTTGPVRVTAPAGSFITSSNFVVPPTITSFTPASGNVGTSVTIYGANLNVGTPAVRFNGTLAATPLNPQYGQLTTTVPAGASSGPITVTTTDGTATSPTVFYLPPVISSFTPTNSASGTVVRINGNSFTNATSVIFNDVPAAGFTVSNNTTIGAIVPAGFTTGPISVTTPGGTTNTALLVTSNFYAAPIISTFTPGHGLPGTNVTITGSSFLGATAVRFQAAGGGTTNATIVSVANGQLAVRVPTNAITGPITVVAPAGSNTSSGSFILDYADLQVSVADDPDPVMVGSDLTYSIQVKNLGPYASSGTLTNVLPPSVSFVSSTAGTTVSNVTRVPLGTLAYLATTNVTIVARPNTGGLTITNLTSAFSGPLPAYAPTVTTTYVEPLRLLSIGVYSPGEVLLSWPTALSNYTLQYQNGLDGAAWVDELNPPAVSGGSNLMVKPSSGGAMFYRLKR